MIHLFSFTPRKLSVKGAYVTFPHRSIGTWISRRAEMTPDRIALEIGADRYTYADLDARARRAAGALDALGAGPGDRVAVLLDSCVEYVDLFFACARIGAIIVPLSTRLAPPELEFMIQDSGSSILIYGAPHLETVKGFLPATGIRNVLAVGDTPDPSYASATETATPIAGPRDVDADEVLAIFYTSGTTGRPKGAMLTHGNVFWTNLNMLISLDLAADERSLVILPLFHVGGWNVNTLAVWLKGGTVVLEPAFDPARTLALIDDKNITSMMGVPTIYQMLADDPAFGATDLSRLKVAVCGGAPLPVELIERYHARNVPFVQGYGLTEAAPNVLMLPNEDAIAKAGAAGRPYFFTDVRVIDAVGNPVEPGGTGEVVVRGPSVMKGYWRRPVETAETLSRGWLHTGDVGRIDETGTITIVDRVKDMYISGGENVYPAEVEAVLTAHRAVADAAVIGVPDARWGETGRAVVVLRADRTATVEELTAHCAERLAKFKVPTSIVFATDLPRTATGKLMKPEIRARHA